MKLLTALQFLTIIPLGRRATAEETGRSLGYFPLVGLILGLFLAGLDRLLVLALPLALVNGLLIVALILLTGALHLDGFVDTCDGMAGPRSPEERWRVMGDSRAGSFGVIGAISLLLVKYISLDSIATDYRLAALVLMPVLGRWAMVYTVFAHPYAKPEGLGKIFKEQANWQRLVMATLTALAVAALLLGLRGLAAMFGIWLIVLAISSYLRRRFAGLTGDTYGAINEMAEVTTLIMVALLARPF